LDRVFSTAGRRKTMMTRSFGTAEFLYLLQAVPWTLLLSLSALAGGGIVGLLIAILRTSPFRVLRWLATGYIELFQGTPVLMQLFVTYYGLAVLFNIQVDAWSAVLLAFTLYSGAFLGEIWRGSIQAIPRPQWEAAECLALSFPQQLRYVILPQAARISIPPTVGFAVQLIKSTSIAAIIGFVELTRAGQLMTDATFQPMIVYPIVAALYFLLCWPLSLLAQTLERRIDAAIGIKQHF
jgi:polar amino acid transport system permease protein